MNRAIDRLDKFISSLDDYEHLLNHSMRCSEMEINVSFDRIVQDVQTRRQLLIDQLRSIGDQKRTRLQGQKEVVESLRKALLSRSTPDSSNQLSSSLEECIEKTSSLDLHCPSTLSPYVNFRAGPQVASRLRRAINSFGRIGTNYSGHFVAKSLETLTSCLPREYESEEEGEYCQENSDFDHNSIASMMSIRRRLTSQDGSTLLDVTNKPSGCQCVASDLERWLAPSSHSCSIKHNNAVIKSPFTSPGSIVEQANKSVNSECKSRKDSYVSTAYSFDLIDSIPNSSLFQDDNSGSRRTRNSSSSNMTDWLFKQTEQLQLDDLPGYTSPFPRRVGDCFPVNTAYCPYSSVTTSETNTVVTSNSSWLQPQPQTVQLTQLAAAAVRAGDSIDMGRWLSPSASYPAAAQHTAMTTAVGDITLDDSGQIVVDLDTDSIASMGGMIESSTATTPTATTTCCSGGAKDGKDGFCCIYTECRGGIGGPTCCRNSSSSFPTILESTDTGCPTGRGAESCCQLPSMSLVTDMEEEVTPSQLPGDDINRWLAQPPKASTMSLVKPTTDVEMVVGGDKSDDKLSSSEPALDSLNNNNNNIAKWLLQPSNSLLVNQN